MLGGLVLYVADSMTGPPVIAYWTGLVVSLSDGELVHSDTTIWIRPWCKGQWDLIDCLGDEIMGAGYTDVRVAGDIWWDTIRSGEPPTLLPARCPLNLCRTAESVLASAGLGHWCDSCRNAMYVASGKHPSWWVKGDPWPIT